MTRPKLTDLKAIIVDAAGTSLTSEEAELFRAFKPAGFILFKRNCVSKAQVKELVASMRECVGRNDIPVLIDQEGGTVSRLKEPEWREYPAAKEFGDIALAKSLDSACDAVEDNFFNMSADLAEIGVTVNCAPVVDVPSADCHAFLASSRTYSGDVNIVTKLGTAACCGMLSGGVTPILKHIPGHGRAKVDSHLSLPHVDASYEELLKSDFYPFKKIAEMEIGKAVWAMGAHVVYSALDADHAATVSKIIVEKVIRGAIGFDGVLLADDVSMKALGGSVAEKVRATLDAGLDLSMICNASFEERKEALEAAYNISERSAARMEAAEKARLVYKEASF